MTRSETEGQQHLATARARGLIFGFVFIVAVLNGGAFGSFNRTLIDMPAWQHVGAPAWAAFSRWADLGTGLILYPLEGIGRTVLSIIVAILFYLNRRTMARSVAVPIYAAALFMLGVMLTTTQAAPTMLSTPHLSDQASLQQALNKFWLWDGVRAGFEFLAGVANLWALVVLSRTYSGREEKSVNG